MRTAHQAVWAVFKSIQSCLKAEKTEAPRDFPNTPQLAVSSTPATHCENLHGLFGSPETLQVTEEHVCSQSTLLSLVMSESLKSSSVTNLTACRGSITQPTQSVYVSHLYSKFNRRLWV